MLPPGTYKDDTTDDDEFKTDSEVEDQPEAEDQRFVEPDGTLSEVEEEEEEPPNFSAVGPGTVSGTVDLVALAQLMDAFGETDPILPERKTQLIEDTEPELCLAPETDEKEPEPEPVPEPEPEPVGLEPRQPKRGTSLVGAFFLVAFLITWATLD